MLNKHRQIASAMCPSLNGKRVTIHRLRHTMAMDLLQAGVDLPNDGDLCRPGGRRWRYYASRAVLFGGKHDAGSIARVPAAQIERLILDSVGPHLAIRQVLSAIPEHRLDMPASTRRLGQGEPQHRSSTEQLTHVRIADAIERVIVGATTREIQLSETAITEGQDRVLTVSWARQPTRRRREIIQGTAAASPAAQAMRSKARGGFVRAIRDARQWLDELILSPSQTIASLAAREGESERSIRMTLSLAFLARPLVQAAIDGRLPRGFGVQRLTDLPMHWPEQWLALGLRDPNEASGQRSPSATFPRRIRPIFSLCPHSSISVAGKRNFAARDRVGVWRDEPRNKPRVRFADAASAA